MMVVARCWWVVVLITLINACSNTSERTTEGSSSSPAPSSQTGRYKGKENDWGPGEEIDMSHVPDANPRYETRTIAGNKNPYTVLGKTYMLMEDERAYKERGKASWYGYKFNGEQTSNGDLYDMFGMTAAHKTLPIPSYVRVTNLANQKSVIVRVNDRGPFHAGRIIDLSYAAAQRIGITKTGTGDVEVEIVVPKDDPRPPLRAKSRALAKSADIVSKKSLGAADPAPAASTALATGAYLQIAAFGAEASAKEFATSVGSKLAYPVVISAANNPQKIYRVRVGPFKTAETLQQARDQLQKINVLQTHVVY